MLANFHGREGSMVAGDRRSVVVVRPCPYLFRTWIMRAGVTTLVAFGRAVGAVGVASFLKASPRLLDHLRDTPGEIPDHFDRGDGTLESGPS